MAIQIFYDTEFLERGPEHPIVPISIGAVAPVGNGQVSTYYREYSLSDEDILAIWKHDWLCQNVLPHLEHSRQNILEIRTSFMQWSRQINPLDEPNELWAWYGAYDHVVLAQTFGTMARMPKNLPMYTRDLKYLCEELCISDDELPAHRGDKHNALVDAQWNYTVYNFLMERS